MPFYVSALAYIIVIFLIAWFVRVDIIDNRRNRRRIRQLEAELSFRNRQLDKSRQLHEVTKRQVRDLRANSLTHFNERGRVA